MSNHSAWTAHNITQLIRLEKAGLITAQGRSLVHSDLDPHNILPTPHRVPFVDWPHARLAAPVVDLVIILASAATDRIDPQPLLLNYTGSTELEPPTIDADLATHAGFLLAGGLSPPHPGLEAIADAKLRLGHGALNWVASAYFLVADLGRPAIFTADVESTRDPRYVVLPQRERLENTHK